MQKRMLETAHSLSNLHGLRSHTNQKIRRRRAMENGRKSLVAVRCKGNQKWGTPPRRKNTLNGGREKTRRSRRGLHGGGDPIAGKGTEGGTQATPGRRSREGGNTSSLGRRVDHRAGGDWGGRFTRWSTRTRKRVWTAKGAGVHRSGQREGVKKGHEGVVRKGEEYGR